MSDERAIEAVTKTLRGLIQRGIGDVPGAGVDTRAPDELTDANVDKLVNLYLFQADVDGALRNSDRVDLLPGETAPQPLPLVLHYVITPFVRNDTDQEAHRLLGATIRVLNDNPVLQRNELAEFAPESDASQQVDRIRITWQPFGEKDIFSLWSAFQTSYRMSVAYEVSAVLIDSRRAPSTPVPVLRRGRQDEGPTARADVRLPFPNITAAVPQRNQTAARLGEPVSLQGGELASATVQARLTHPLVADPLLVDIPAADVTAGAVTLTLDDADPQRFPAGLWSVGLALTDQIAVDGETGTVTSVTNDVPLTIAPRITDVPATVARAVDGSVVIPVAFTPRPLPGQQVFLLFDGRAISPDPQSADPRFVVADAAPGPHLIRVRVAGVDSLLVDRSGAKPAFDPTQSVTVT